MICFDELFAEFSVARIESSCSDLSLGQIPKCHCRADGIGISKEGPRESAGRVDLIEHVVRSCCGSLVLGTIVKDMLEGVTEAGLGKQEGIQVMGRSENDDAAESVSNPVSPWSPFRRA